MRSLVKKCATCTTQAHDKPQCNQLMTPNQGRIQEFKKGGSFKRVRAERAEKNLVDHAYVCQTTPILIKTRLHELYYEP